MNTKKFTAADFDFMKKAKQVGTNSGCIRGESRFGAIAVRDGEVLAIGWNGAVGEIPPCEQTGQCIRTVMKIPSGTHREIAHCICAEQRLICNAAKNGVALNGAILYVTGLPCEMCVRLIVAAGFVQCVYTNEYGTSERSYNKAQLAGLELIRMEL